MCVCRLLEEESTKREELEKIHLRQQRAISETEAEKKELEKERTDLLEDVTSNKRKMKELEDNLLYRLTSTQARGPHFLTCQSCDWLKVLFVRFKEKSRRGQDPESK